MVFVLNKNYYKYINYKYLIKYILMLTISVLDEHSTSQNDRTDLTGISEINNVSEESKENKEYNARPSYASQKEVMKLI